MTHTNHVITSSKLGKNVNVRVYGTKGYPIIAFPTQDQMADEWEANGMTDVFAPYVDAGRVQLFTVDSNDLESWSNPSTDFAARIARQEDYYNFVCDELLPFVHEANNSMLRPELTGASLGATQATICALRRPDLFQGVIALSGMYHTSYFFGNWGNALSYANDVNAFLPNTPADHPYIQLYRQRTFAFSIGQAADEQFGVSDLHFLQQTFDRLGISGWFDFWGPECNHDWYWWKQQMAKFLPEAVTELEGVAASEPELCKPATKKVPAAQEPVADKASATQEPADKKVSDKKTAAAVEKRVSTSAASKGEGHKANATAKPSFAKAGTGAHARQAEKRVATKATAANAPKMASTVSKSTNTSTQAKSEAVKATTTDNAKAVKAEAVKVKAAASAETATKVASTKAAPAKTATAPKPDAVASVSAKATVSTSKSTAATSASATKAATAKASASKAAKSPRASRAKSGASKPTARRSNGTKSTRTRKTGKKSAK